MAISVGGAAGTGGKGSGAPKTSSSASTKGGGGVSSSTPPAVPATSLISQLFTATPGDRIPGTRGLVTLSRPKSKAVALIHGLDGCGKTSFVVRHSPGPIGLLNFDRRGEEIAYDAMETYGKTVHYLDAALPANIANYSAADAKLIAQEVLDATIHDYDWMIEEARQDRLATIGLDTGTELTRMLYYATTGHPIKERPTKDSPGDFGASSRAINEYIWYFVNRARECRKVNLIILSRCKEEYAGPKPLGTYTWDCHKVFHQAVTWSAHLAIVSTAEKEAELAAKSPDGKLSSSDILRIRREGPSFSLRVTKTGFPDTLPELGRTYLESDWGEDGPFAYACSKLIPGTEIEEWKE